MASVSGTVHTRHVHETQGVGPAADPVQAFFRALMLRCAAELRLADALARPCTLSDLAAATGTRAEVLHRLLRALVAEGSVRQDGDRYALTDAGQRLRSDVPGSEWGRIMAMASPRAARAWFELPTALRTGGPVFETANGMPFWDYLRAHPEAAAEFDAAMASATRGHPAADLVAASQDLGSVTTLVDVAGGTGQLLGSLVSRAPHLRGVLADQHDVVAKAQPVFEGHGVADRCRAEPSDFFASVPGGGDAYVLSNILHDWPDEQALAILRTVRAAAPPGARLWVLENVLPDPGAPPTGDDLRKYLLDLVMLINFGARERTFDEYAALLDRAGFSDVAMVPAREAGQDLVTAVRA